MLLLSITTASAFIPAEAVFPPTLTYYHIWPQSVVSLIYGPRRRKEVQNSSLAAGLTSLPVCSSLPPSPSLPLYHSSFTLSYSDTATSVQFSSCLIHVLRVNGNKLSKLFEPPTGQKKKKQKRRQ